MDAKFTEDMVTAMSPAHGQSEAEAFEASLWAMALMPVTENTRIQRGETGEAIGHRSVTSW